MRAVSERDKPIPWTSLKFAHAMRRAGWENRGHGWYVHERTKREFYAWNSDDGKRENWKEWAAVQQTPPPF